MACSKAVVFDYGGVLAIPDNRVLSQFFCNLFQITEEELQSAKIEKKASSKTSEEFWAEFALEKSIAFPKEWKKLYKEAILQSLGVNEEMYSMIHKLKKRGIKVAVFSNMEERYAQNMLEYGLLAPFDLHLFSFEIGVKKPNPAAYQSLLQKIELPAKDIIFIDDTIENVVAAKEAGIDAIIFTSKEQVEKELQERDVL
ncbi:hypothetical protein ACTFIY_009608 [Dictyostelium cf. discoideum]